MAMPRPPKRLPRAFSRTLTNHRERLNKLIDKRGAERLKSVYDDANRELGHKLRKVTEAGRGQTMTAYQHNVALGQIRQGQALLMRHLTGQMGDLSREAQHAAVAGLTDDIARLSMDLSGAEIALPLEEAMRFRGIYDARASSLLRMHATSFARYGSDLVSKMESQLTRSLMTGDTPAAAIDAIEDISETEWWQAERIVRTETAWAFNAAEKDALFEASREVPELKMMWSEHVSQDGQPLDNRVAVDSLAMHGQVASPGGLFIMPDFAPDGREVPESLQGKAWEFPPNRPNDRSVLSPWHQDWGVPGWEYDDSAPGQRSWIVKR